jgi:hypothetical protein
MASSGTTSHKTRFTGAQLIVHLLERQGITTVAGIPGASRAGCRLYRPGHGAYSGQTGGLYGL